MIEKLKSKLARSILSNIGAPIIAGVITLIAQAKVFILGHAPELAELVDKIDGPVVANLVAEFVVALAGLLVTRYVLGGKNIQAVQRSKGLVDDGYAGPKFKAAARK